MKRHAWLLTLLTATLAGGCVERRYVIYSDPPGALVYKNGVYLGATPVDDYFVYYGKYEFTLVKEGYEPLRVVQDIPAPWYELPGPDFVSEAVVPVKIRDVRSFCYTLQPQQTVRPDDLLNNANALRARGQSIGAPREPRPAPPEPPPPPGVAPLGPPQLMPPAAVKAP
jgi:hypothetical protein